MATNIFTMVNLVKGYGRLSKKKSAIKLDPSKANPNLDITPKESITKLPKGGKKTLLVSGPKNFDFTEGHEKQLVRNFRNFEKKYGSAQIAHDYNPSNKTSAFVARVAKKYNLPTLEDRPISHKDYNPDPSKKEGFKNKAIAIQKGVDEGKVLRLSYSQKGKLREYVGVADKNLRSEWRLRLPKIKAEQIISSGGIKSSKWRSKNFNPLSKNTQAYRPISALMDEIKDHPVGSAKREAGLGFLKEYNEDLEKRLGRPSYEVTQFLEIEEDTKLPEGHKLRYEIDDIADAQADPIPKTRVLLQKPRPPWRRDAFAKIPGLGKPKRVKIADTADTVERRYIEKFEDAYDQGTTSDGLSAKEKKELKPASKTILTGSQKEARALAKIRTGPDTYGQSSLSQLESSALESPEFEKEAEVRKQQRKDLQETKPIDVEGESADKNTTGKGTRRHKESYGEQQDVEFKKDIQSIEEDKSVYKSIKRQNKKLKKQGKPLITGKTLLTSQRDPLKWDRQSKTFEHISDVEMPKETQTTAKTLVEIKKGPNPFGYNTSKERAIRENKTGIVTAKTRSLILAPRKGVKTKLSKFPLLSKVSQPSVKVKPIVKVKPTPAMIRAAYKKAQQTFGISFSKKLPLPKPKTKIVTSEVTPNLIKVTSTAKPSKKVVTSTAKKVSSNLQKVFHKPTGTPNVEDKHKKLKFTGKGIKFTRGLGAFNLFSTILTPIRARKEAEKELGREPTLMESLNYILPEYARKKQSRYNAPI